MRASVHLLNLITFYPDIQHFLFQAARQKKAVWGAYLFLAIHIHNCFSTVLCHEFWNLFCVKCIGVLGNMVCEERIRKMNSAYLKLAFSLPFDLLISLGDAYKLTFRCSFTPSHHLFVHRVLTYSLCQWRVWWMPVFLTLFVIKL